MSEELQKEAKKELRKGLRKGWSTGACASAAGKAAMLGFLRGEFPTKVDHKVTISLPRGERPEFTLERAGFLRKNDSVDDSVGDSASGSAGCYAVVRKDAGDDPDVTHRALILVAIEPQKEERAAKATKSDKSDKSAKPESLAADKPLALTFRAGRGVGIVTLAGLPLAVDEPAINPSPRRMILANLQEALEECREECPPNPRLAQGRFRVTIAVANGVRLAERTWNARLGIIGGLSILGTTGIVVPYSCSAWIHAIHSGVDVARANGTHALAAATGRTSEQSVMRLLELPQESIIDMGDFAGGMLKYMRKHPIGCLTIAGGFGKMVKLAQGNSDLHSGRSSVDLVKLAELAKTCGGGLALCEGIKRAPSAAAVLALLADSNISTTMREAFLRRLAVAAREETLRLLKPSRFPIGIVIIDRAGEVLVHLPAH